LNVLLDTNAWLMGGLGDPRLSRGAREVLEAPHVARHLSVISLWEVGLLVRKGRLELDSDPWTWFRTGTRKSRVRVLPLTADAAIESNELEGFASNDPADRFIVATARLRGWPVVTADEAMRSWDGVETIW
jgi:PIN domain nuclease of toxin-antitoxin system